MFFPWLCPSHGFSKHAREQYEKLSTMHKNMQKLYENIGSYFSFDPHSVSVEEFFGELANFRMLFMVSAQILIFAHAHDDFHVCFSFQSKRIEWLTEAAAHTRAYFCTHSLAHIGCEWIENSVCLLHMHTFSSNFQVRTGGGKLCENYTASLSRMNLNGKKAPPIM